MLLLATLRGFPRLSVAAFKAIARHGSNSNSLAPRKLFLRGSRVARSKGWKPKGRRIALTSSQKNGAVLESGEAFVRWAPINPTPIEPNGTRVHEVVTISLLAGNKKA